MLAVSRDSLLMLLLFIIIPTTTDAASGIGKTCRKHDDCDGFGQECFMYSGCQKGQCGCQPGYSSKGNRCIQKAMVGGLCDADRKCPVDATCRNQVCLCEPNMKPSVDKIGCVDQNMSALGQSCGGDAGNTCQQKAEGVDLVCRCKNGFIQQGVKCARGGHGQTCSADGLHCIGTLNCANTVCGCFPDHIWYKEQSKCVHRQAKTKIRKGSSCDHSDGQQERAKWCKKGLVCTHCAKETDSKKQCRELISGAPDFKTSFILTIFTLMLYVMY